MIAGIAAALAAPRLARAQSARRITLRITHGFIAIHQPMVAALVRRFMELNPDIAVEAQPGGDNWDPHLQATLRSGLIGDLPDLSHQTLAYTRVLQRRGFVQPLDGFIAESGGVDALGVPRPLVESARFGGETYAMPVSTTLPVIYYNQNLLRRAGRSGAALPDDWAGNIAAARSVAELGGQTIGGYIEYTATNAWMFQNILTSLGGRMVNADESDIAFDSAEGLETLRILQAFGTASVADMTQNQARQAFDAGTVGLLVRSASGIPAVQEAARGRFDVGIGLFPVPSPQGQLAGAGNGVVLFARAPERQRAAWAWIRFVMSPEAQAVIARMTGYMPVSLVAARDDRYLGDYYRENPLQRALIAKLAVTSDWYSFPDNPVRIFDAMAEHVRRVIVGQASPEQGMAAMAAETRRLMRQG
jgi:multiple sugar transport system substrate-binding protein